MSTGTANMKAAPAPRLPIFGVEIELYVKVKPHIEASIREKRRTNPKSLPEWWQKWDFDLLNDPPTVEGQKQVVWQRLLGVSPAVQADIDAMLGPGNGWNCVSDPSMVERKLALPPNARKWWGVEIVSPPMSVTKQWQHEIEMIYTAICKNFNIWTTHYSGCHVHISPGPVQIKKNDYTLPQLVSVAKGAFFWEEALREFLPSDRHDGEYARPNYKVFATQEYEAVRSKGWGPVFKKIEMLAVGETAKRAQKNFITEIQGGKRDGDRYTSFNFTPFPEIGTVEFRRQAGVLSPITTTHRILLALGLHLSALRYDFDAANGRKTYPSAEELRKELAGCIKNLPETCHGTRFLNYLSWCHESYKDGKRFTEAQINAREQALLRGLPLPVQQSAIPPPPPPEGTIIPGQGRPASQGQQAPSARGRAPPAGANPGVSAGAGTGTGTGTGRSRNTAPQGGGERVRPPAAADTAPRPTTGTGGRNGGTPQGTASGRASGGRPTGGAANAPSSGPGGASGPRGPPPRPTGGTTTRLPERPAPSSASSASRTGGGAAGGNGRSNGGAAASASASTSTRRTVPAGNNNGGGAAAGGAPPVRRRRQEGDGTA
ncbi:uncharacterized protein B0H64DRAFT_318436 [Chaetomium fimeti]|uniref:Uncharacterized protein n=1 Tax=Chaetomium fimeti TaxID=1854472 RepID=A0AAE0HLI6_9PEZI|nr:hypothetical protein B0H64DRAFT_318436 [Chaetomium fimeti]